MDNYMIQSNEEEEIIEDLDEVRENLRILQKEMDDKKEIIPFQITKQDVIKGLWEKSAFDKELREAFRILNQTSTEEKEVKKEPEKEIVKESSKSFVNWREIGKDIGISLLFIAIYSFYQ